MTRAIYRKSDPLNVVYEKSQRLVFNDRGVFYKVRGGRMNGPFESEQAACDDLSVFKQVIKIEEQLDTENLRLFN